VSRLVASELLKLRTTRTSFGIVGAAIGLMALIVAAVAAAASFGPADRPGLDLLDVGIFASYFALILGVLAVSTEFRHGTITPTLLATPNRTRVVLAKLIAHAVAGLLFGLAAYGLISLLLFPILAARGVDSGIDTGTAVEMIVGGSLAAALTAAIGVGVGAIVRNQVGAVVAVLVYLFMIEPLLSAVPGLVEPIEKYGLHGGISALSASPTDSSALGQVGGGLLMLAIAGVLLAIGIATLRARDVTA
jgi:ABC-2 type transport system permease protein